MVEFIDNPFSQHLKSFRQDQLQDSILEAPLPLQSLLDSDGVEPWLLDLKLAAWSLNDVELFAVSGPGASVQVRGSSSLSLLYVTAGAVNVTLDQLHWQVTPGSCLLVPGGRYGWQSGSFSLVCLKLNWAAVSDRLALIAPEGVTMTAAAALKSLGRPRLIRGLHHELEASVLACLDQTLRLLSQLIAVNATQPLRLSVANQIAQLMLLLVFPELCSQPELTKAPDAGQEVRDPFDDLIDYIKANLDQALNLTVLERRSHYSRRTLQYAFRERFGCTATQWIRAQRLDLAYRLLKTPAAESTVASIAQACGYRSMSLFSIEFQQRFHCKPSLLLRESRPSGQG